METMRHSQQGGNLTASIAPNDFVSLSCIPLDSVYSASFAIWWLAMDCNRVREVLHTPAIHSDRNRRERADIGGARSAGTGMYTEVCRYAARDAEHRATPMPVRAVDLCRYV